MQERNIITRHTIKIENLLLLQHPEVREIVETATPEEDILTAAVVAVALQQLKHWFLMIKINSLYSIMKFQYRLCMKPTAGACMLHRVLPFPSMPPVMLWTEYCRKKF